MNLDFVRLTLGPLPNNVYLLGDQESGDAVVIDPTFKVDVILARADALGWQLRQIWLTHGHFDHIAGVHDLANAFDPPLPVGLHPGDLDWFQNEGGAAQFGMKIPAPPEPTIFFEEGMSLSLTNDHQAVVEVRHAPGHSSGHVMFYCQRLGALFCGDVIFREGIGRTDLIGGDLDTLLKSIREQVFTLPDATLLLPGHGPETTVAHERKHNPYLS